MTIINAVLSLSFTHTLFHKSNNKYVRLYSIFVSRGRYVLKGRSPTLTCSQFPSVSFSRAHIQAPTNACAAPTSCPPRREIFPRGNKYRLAERECTRQNASVRVFFSLLLSRSVTSLRVSYRRRRRRRRFTSSLRGSCLSSHLFFPLYFPIFLWTAACVSVCRPRRRMRLGGRW